MNHAPWRWSLAAAFIPLLLGAPHAAAHPDPAHSLAELERHLAETPEDANLHLRKAELLLKRNHPETARPSVERALALAPENPEVALLEVRLPQAEGKLPEALDAAREITRRFPAYAAGWKWLARMEKDTGGTDAAISAKQRHLSFKDSVDPGDFLIAATWIKDRNGKDDLLLALATLDEAVVRFGPMMALQQAAIPLEISLRRYDPALARVTALSTKYGPSAATSLLRADIQEAAGRHAEAAAACDSAIALLDLQPSENGDPLSGLKKAIRERKEENLRKVR